jgi:predicted lactoylglutathione lyase
MTVANPRKIFVNLPVRDLDRSKAFFGALGFAFDPRFTDDNAACMVVSDEGYVMLLRREFFATFTARPVGDAAQSTSGLVALTCRDRAEVDDLVRQALAAGGSRAKDPMDHGFMYGCSFFDPDGHHWEVFWMDPAAVEHGCAEGAAKQ